MPIYTKTGDKGKTALFDGTRVLKSSYRVETYGTIDELNSCIGTALAFLPPTLPDIHAALEAIQHDLFEIGSSLAMHSSMPIVGLRMRIQGFETLIDSLTEKLPALTNFILPGGSNAGSQLHLARTVCRRAERRVVALMQTEAIDQETLIYLNRLSDLLFTLARYTNHAEKIPEIVWVKK